MVRNEMILLASFQAQFLAKNGLVTYQGSNFGCLFG